MKTEKTKSRRRTFYFNTGVRPGIPANEAHMKGAKPVPLMPGQVWLNGTKQIPYDCEDVPDGAVPTFFADSPDLHPHSGYIVRELHNTAMISKYAYFLKPLNHE